MITKAERYENIDGLKAFVIIGIVLMHVLANGEYKINRFVFEKLTPSFTNHESIVIYYWMGRSTYTILFFWNNNSLYLGTQKGLLINPIFKCLGNICFEIYLSHMVIYRDLKNFILYIFQKMNI